MLRWVTSKHLLNWSAAEDSGAASSALYPIQNIAHSLHKIVGISHKHSDNLFLSTMFWLDFCTSHNNATTTGRTSPVCLETTLFLRAACFSISGWIYLLSTRKIVGEARDNFFYKPCISRKAFLYIYRTERYFKRYLKVFAIGLYHMLL